MMINGNKGMAKNTSRQSLHVVIFLPAFRPARVFFFLPPDNFLIPVIVLAGGIFFE
jgi:hypothetical protein